ncbi:MAG: 3-oxoacyl-ACP reductase FabG [Polyangiaceae bacterium]
MSDFFSSKTPRRVLVTGAARGIGAATARLLAADGHRVVINYRGNHAAAEEVLEAIRRDGGTATALAFDVGDPEAVSEAFGKLEVKTDPFSVVINNAGIAIDGPFAGMKRTDWDPVLRTSLDGFFNITQPLTLSLVRQRFGRVINLVSFSGEAGNRGQVNYAAAKAALIGATKSLAKEVANRGVTVNAVCPGLIDTDMIRHVDLEAFIRRIPLQRLGTASEVAQAIRFLVSDAAGYITGHVLHVSGGFSG